MKIAVIKETMPDERRVALVPESCKKLIAAGISVTLQRGAGADAGFPDQQYVDVGVTLADDAAAALRDADLLAKVQPPTPAEAEMLREGSLLLTSLIPSRNMELVKKLVQRRATSFSTELIPRITRAQAMDTLSSMSNIAGYKAVLIAANELPRYFPMLMTAAGTVLPAKVFVIGAGVAGLQAIATAKRLGAQIEATDTRPAVKTEIESLGAKFVGVDTTESAQDAGGYAKELSADFYKKQAELIGERCAVADVVITTALIGGVKAPRLITGDMVQRMKPGSVIVDLAAPGGGNCELTEPGKTVVKHGVTICAPLNLPSEVPYHGSTLWSRNLTTFVMTFWKDKQFQLDLNDDILKGATLTHDGKVLHAQTRDALAAGG
ncbi:MAG: Re/Si-specific NAD(P)(+) transhydrogenase subunit alpha [Phycisphaerales bacterium]|nr:Re/Si-specific NAD(P)(+) transhydrogenase subunit alpha [Phycisphaerales bacterium]